MDIKSLQEWLRQNRQAGLSDAQIGEQLRSTGWTDQQITELFSGDMFRQGQLEAVGASKKNDFDTMAGFSASQTGTGGSLPGVFELMGQAWDLFKSRIGNLIIISAISLILGAVVGGAIFVIGGLGAGYALFSLNGINGTTQYITLIGSFVLYLLIISLIYSWIQASIIIAITNTDSGVGYILSRAFRLTLPYWWLTILMGFLTAGASMLFAVPGIVFSIWFSFGIFVLIAEDTRGFQALLKSKEYVRGYWWAVLGRNLGMAVLVTIPISLISAGLAYTKIAALGMIFNGIVFVFFLPYAISFSYTIYTNLRSIKGSSIQITQKKAGIIITAILGWCIIPIMFITIGGAALWGTKSKVADASRKSDISQLRIAAVLYYDDNHTYPFSLTELAPKYISTVPTDPKTNEPYTYTLLENGSDFSICAQLDNKDVFGNKEYCVESGYSSSTNSYNSAFR